ncbi:MAG TPA: methyltransferase domain-containing protein [Sphingobacteriaceae bacterium]
MEKHYNRGYLEDTGNFLKQLKEATYTPFTHIQDGIVIDLGCGTGMDVIQISALLRNSVKVVGIDHDDNMLEKGRAAVSEDPNIEFICAEAFPIPFENDTVSGLRAERLVQHLKEPQRVMNDIHRVLQPNAPLVIVETDWPGLIFYNEHRDIEQKLVHYLTHAKINNGEASRKIVAYMEESGFKNIQIDIFPFVLRTLKEANMYLWIDKIIHEAADQNYISNEEHQLFMNALESADAKKCFTCSINMLVVSALK